MTVVNWVAADTASWIFLSIGILNAALAVVSRNKRIPWFFEDLSTRSLAVVGLLLLLGGAVLVGMGEGRLSWLSIFSGAVCLLVFAFLWLEKAIQNSVYRRRAMEDAFELLTERFRHETAELRRDIRYLSGPAGYPSPSEIADAVYNKLVENGKISSSWAIADAVYIKLVENGKIPSSWAIAEDVSQRLGSGPFGRSPSVIVEEAYRSLVDKGLLPTPSEIADGVSRKRNVEGNLPPRTVGNFEDFANSMVRAGNWTAVSVYTSADDGTALKDAVVAVLREFGLESAVEEPPVRGSWLQRSWARIREVAGSEPMRERLAKLERAIELEQLGKRQAEIDKAKAESVAALHGVIKEQENAVVRMGSIIMIKTAGDLVVWTIGPMEASALDEHSELLQDPVAALKFLRRGKRVHEPIGLEPPDRDALSG